MQDTYSNLNLNHTKLNLSTVGRFIIEDPRAVHPRLELMANND